MDDESRRARLRRRGIVLEWGTLVWNVAGVVVLAALAWRSGSIALLGFGLDSLIEIGASTVVLWELSGSSPRRQRRALQIIGLAFAFLSIYLVFQSVVSVTAGHRTSPSVGGVIWTSLTVLVMLVLARAKIRTGRELGNPVLQAEGRVTLVDAAVAGTVLAGLLVNSLLGWWWADPVAGLLIASYAAHEAWTIRKDTLQAREA